MAVNSASQEFYVNILRHTVKCVVHGKDGVETPTELDEASQEHVLGLIIEGYNQGELHVMGGPRYEHEFRGWWSLE